MNKTKRCRHGDMTYRTNDLYIGRSFDLYGEFSEGEVELFRQVVRPGQTVLDVGANIGAHTIPLARLVGRTGRVLAFEPQRTVFYLLCGNVAQNNMELVVHCHFSAVGERPGAIAVPELDPEAEQNFGGLSLLKTATPGASTGVPVVRIDDLHLTACDFIKVDVEGMEREVLLGASDTIRRFRPLLYVEDDQADKSPALHRCLSSLGYEMFRHDPPLFNPQNFLGNGQNVFPRIASFNVFARHIESALPIHPEEFGMQLIRVEPSNMPSGGVPSPLNRESAAAPAADAGIAARLQPGGPLSSFAVSPSLQPSDCNVDLQHPFDVAVVIPTIGRPSLMRAVRSIWEQNFAGRIQILIGFDRPSSDEGLLAAIAKGPPNCATTVLNLGYSTSRRNGGLYPAYSGGALRTLLSYAANSRHVAYVDDDNWWGKTHLSTLMHAVRDVDWAFSLRWYVDPVSSEPLCVDQWESVGPDAGAFKEMFGGFVDPNCLLIDKIACEPVLRLWNCALMDNGTGDDRQVFDYLRCHHRCRGTGVATSYYLIDPKDCNHPQRQRWIASVKSAASPAAFSTQVALGDRSVTSAASAGSASSAAAAQAQAAANASLNLGLALYEQGRLAEAQMAFQQALSAKPDFAEAHNNLGLVCAAQGQVEGAVAAYRRAIALKPDFAEAHHNLGLAFRQLGQLEPGLASCREAVRLMPEMAQAHNSLGSALQELGRHEEAVASLLEALRLKPDLAQAHNNLGIAYWQLGRLEEAVASYRRAAELAPLMAEAQSNLATVLRDLGEVDEAMSCYDHALEIKPDYSEARWNRSLLSLLKGDLERGWSEYECRWTLKTFQRRKCPQPIWDGSPLEGKTILLAAEQGLGDTIQFLRYAPLLKRRGARVLAEVHRPLRRLAKTCPGVDKVVVLGEPPPDFDTYVPLMSLPRLFKTTLDNVPADVPYLSAEPAYVEQWRKEIASLPGFKIGIAWRGSPQNGMDRSRSIPLAMFETLAKLPRVTLVSLQKGVGAEQIAEVADRFSVMDYGPRLDETSGPFVDTAGLMNSLDLVITCDSALAHLAGALGVRVWIALMRTPDWRWLLDREDSPWYPTARLFRQPCAGDWQGAFARMAETLSKLVDRT